MQRRRDEPAGGVCGCKDFAETTFEFIGCSKALALGELTVQRDSVETQGFVE